MIEKRMSDFTGNHILSVNQFDREAIEKVFSVANSMQPYAKRQKRTTVLDGAILGNLFFEPSTVKLEKPPACRALRWLKVSHCTTQPVC